MGFAWVLEKENECNSFRGSIVVDEYTHIAADK